MLNEIPEIIGNAAAAAHDVTAFAESVTKPRIQCLTDSASTIDWKESGWGQSKQINEYTCSVHFFLSRVIW